MRKNIDEIIEELKERRDFEFRSLCDEAVEKCDKLLEQRGQSYNQGGVHITDYGDALRDRVKARLYPLWENVLRIKSEVNCGLKPEDKVLDLINFARFIYAEIMMSERDKSDDFKARS